LGMPHPSLKVRGSKFRDIMNVPAPCFSIVEAVQAVIGWPFTG
jgi:hypothetical protein